MSDHYRQLDIKEMLPRGRQLFVWIFLAAWAVAGLLFLLFYAWQVAFAGVVLEQTEANVSEARTEWVRQTLGSGLTGEIREIVLKYTGTNACILYEENPTIYSVAQLRDAAGNVQGTYLAREKLADNNCLFWLAKTPYPGWQEVGFQLQSGTEYGIWVGMGGKSPPYNFTFYGSNNAASYPNGKAQYLISWPNWGDFAVVKDLYFIAGVDVVEPPYFFEFYYPTDEAALNTDFSNWSFDIEVPESGLYAIRVFYKRVGGEFLSDRMEANLVAETGYILSPHKGALLGIGDWYAKAWLERYWPEEQEWEIILPTEREITFSIGYIVPPGEPETGDPFDIGICEDPEFTWIEKALCVVNIRVLRALFVPTPESLNRFSTLKDTIMNKPPIGYFYAVKDAFGGLSGQAPAFDLSIAGEEALEPIFKPLRAGFGFILWLFFGVWAVKRISHLEL